MPKRSRSRSSSAARPGKRGGRGWYGGLPATPISTPQQRGRTMTRSGSRSRSERALSVASRLQKSRSLSRVSSAAKMAGPYGRIAGYGLDAYNAYSTGRGIYSDIFGASGSKRKSGAHSNSKAAGYFGGAKYNVNAVDRHAQNGIVIRKEFGSVKQDPSNQVLLLQQSTAPANVVARAAIGAMLKRLFNYNQVQVRSLDTLVLQNSTYDNSILLWHKEKDGNAITQTRFSVPRATATVNTITDEMFTWFNAFRFGQIPDQFLRLQLLEVFSLGNETVMVTMNITNLVFNFDTTSTLKIQNRTINSSGNDTSEDVDNVPIFGKFYDISTNSTIFNDYSSGASSAQLTTDPDFGVLPTSLAFLPVSTTSLYKELPMQKQFAGCKKSGKSHLDPGEIKTSVLKDSFVFPLNLLMKKLFSKITTAISGPERYYTQYWIGKSRIFAFEKMINAVAMTAENQFNIAYEHQVDIGCTCIVKRDNLTAAQMTVANTLP
nr:MAG: capsid protein [Virus sp.]